ncbi:MAG: hypothetical protein Q4G04_02750 [bacterium]|nr:hypothetical protein [bacterium]
MTIEQIINKLKNDNSVSFKLYSLIYKIKYKNNKYYISSSTSYNRISSFNSIDELLDNYLMYNETIIQNENRIVKIKQ